MLAQPLEATKPVLSLKNRCFEKTTFYSESPQKGSTRQEPVLRGGSAKFNPNAMAEAWFGVVFRHLVEQIVVFAHIT